MAKHGPKPVDKMIGAAIRTRRKALNMTQEALAGALGLTFQQVQKYERGTNRVSASTLLEIARALKCRVEDIYPDQDETPADRARALPAALLATTRGGLRLAERYIAFDPDRQDALLRVAEAMSGAPAHA